MAYHQQQLARNTAAAVGAGTPVSGEIVVVTDGYASGPELTVGDGSTAGGRRIASVARLQDMVTAAMPPGAVIDFAGASLPTGWLWCDGAAVSRSTYAGLFTAIGTAFGAGDGSTTFNVPDARGRVTAGKDNMGGIDAARLTNSGTGNPGINGDALGASGGADRHTLTSNQMPSHSHSYLASSGTLLHAQVTDGTLGSQSSSTGTAGAGDAHPNCQPTIVLNKIIRT